MEFISVGKTEEIPAGTMKIVNIKENEALLANVGGEYYAIANRCPHAGGSLGNGTLMGDIVTCPRHKAQFNVKTGRCVSGPKIAFLKLQANDVKVFKVKVEKSNILLEID